MLASMSNMEDFARRLGISTSPQKAEDGALVMEYDDEAVASTYSNVKLFIGEDEDLGPGTLHVTNRWVRVQRRS